MCRDDSEPQPLNGNPVACDRKQDSRKTPKLVLGKTSGITIRCGDDEQGIPMAVVDYKCSVGSGKFRVDKVNMLQSGHPNYPNPTPVVTTGIECRYASHDSSTCPILAVVALQACRLATSGSVAHVK